MKYIINLIVIFDPDNRVLTLKNDLQQSVELSKPATRLLCELLNNNRTSLLRDDILKSVWEDYGFSPSNASLNNHISELRKAFTNLGMNKEIIFTVPRVGFRMDAEIHPIQKQTETIKEEASSTEIPFSEGPNSSTTISSAKMMEQGDHRSIYLSLKKHKMISFILALLLLLTLVAGTRTLIHTNKEDVNFLINHDKCSLYTLNDNKPSESYTAKIVKEIAEEGIDCSQQELDIFYAEARPNNDRLRIRLIAACSKIGSDKYNNCLNYKTVE
ncbi:DNA-binding winged helix-turn-helix (wHTH) protein [Serratia fonticola]|uniref:DNA-binding winged helix-turn-helix (WHTH) protein n=1 Tax=Serratia fonticola TaxID=47917 RepID=A0A542CY07_SERFO|nr:winged helix-turn-helix domain-containing protein [Serratia fonticola]TQI82269.1 DNA-binding winged helix-turn-helix (wHTH) protein [Serratia fonticola]TQI95711.1 DNA-binding winged helix-turn-helix (wHTH) protein [Serratia fonticola]TVZ70207.1 DNA-binding winged helix-turn-helix (wHTH) protein [Serratia fonticola]